jgi:Integrase core domain
VTPNGVVGPLALTLSRLAQVTSCSEARVRVRDAFKGRYWICSCARRLGKRLRDRSVDCHRGHCRSTGRRPALCTLPSRSSSICPSAGEVRFQIGATAWAIRRVPQPKSGVPRSLLALCARGSRPCLVAQCLPNPRPITGYPGHPQQNGHHERMHLTLKKEATKPAAANFLQQQARFDKFIEVFNNERPPMKLSI